MDYCRRPQHAVILAGGRKDSADFRNPGIPQPLIPFAGKPFLAYQLEHLAALGITHVTLTTHYRGGQIAEYLAKAPTFGLAVELQHESKRLGCGGSLCHFARKAPASASPFLFVYGNRLVACDRYELAVADGEARLLAAEVQDTAGYPTLSSEAGELNGLSPARPVHQAGTIFSGAAVIQPSWLACYPPGTEPVSFELDILSHWLQRRCEIRVSARPRALVDLAQSASFDHAESDLAAFQKAAEPVPA